MTDHRCPGRCGRYVPRQKLACRWCWYRLPADLRRPVSDNYGRDTGAHMEAVADALRWYRANPIPRSS